MNCTADARSDSCEVWVPTQTPETAHVDIMKRLGLPAEAVKIHTTLLGGGFGRRLFVDYVHEAVELSKASADRCSSSGLARTICATASSIPPRLSS